MARKQGGGSTDGSSSEGQPRLSPKALPSAPARAQLEVVQEELRITDNQLLSRRQRFELQEVTLVSSLSSDNVWDAACLVAQTPSA